LENRGLGWEMNVSIAYRPFGTTIRVPTLFG
jgi:hypothetical protein